MILFILYTDSLKPKSAKDYRLPKNLKPFHYKLFLKSNFNVLTPPEFYEGHVRIDFTCLKNTSKLVLHKATDLQILNSTLELTSSIAQFQTIRNFNWSYDETLEFFILVFDFKKNVFTKNNNYSVHIGFKRYFRDDGSMSGLYRRFYIDSNGTQRF